MGANVFDNPATRFRRRVTRTVDGAALSFELQVTLLALLLSVFQSITCAAPPETTQRDWEVLRVFIRDEPAQLDRLVTPSYATVLLDDLARELSEEEELRKTSSLDLATLEEAIYLSRVEGDFIVSDQSQWKPSRMSSKQPIELGNTSLAIRSARNISADKLPLANRLQFTTSGQVELNHLIDDGEYWFGFSAKSIRQGATRNFSFQIPPATKAKMLLAAPLSVEISSPSVVVERIVAPLSQLPENWPTESALQATAAVSQWWLVHLSGVSRFELHVDQKSERSLTSYKHLITSAAIDYVIDKNSLVARGSFRVKGYDGSAPLLIQAGRGFKMETVLADGLPAKWRAQPHEDRDLNLIEMLDLETTEHDILLEIRAISRVETTRMLMLPELAIAESYALDGKCRIFGKHAIVVDHVQTSSGVLSQVPEVGNSGEGNVWQANWMGNMPQLEATFAVQQNPVTARSLTRFSIQTDWLSANCRMRIDSLAPTSNEFRLAVGNNWFVDSVRLMQPDFDVRVRVEDRKEAASPVVVIYWEGARDQISLEVEVVAHSPRDTAADSIALRSPRLITVPNADQIDNYCIESSGRFTVQLNSNLLPYQLSPLAIPEWQKQLIPQQTEKGIFQGVRGAIPPIKLTISSGTFSSRVTALVRNSEAKTILETHIDCIPISGSVDYLSLVLPAGVGDNDFQWTLLSEDGDEPLQLPPSATPRDIQATQQERIFELELPRPLNNPFTITSELQIELPTAQEPSFSVPIVGLPMSTQGETILLLPRGMAATLEQAAVELLPAEVCCSNNDLTAFRSTPEVGGRHNDWVAARLKMGVSHLVQLQQRPQPASSGWVWSEIIEHKMLENGQVIHDVQWVVEGAEQPFQAVLPKGWKLSSAWVNDKPVDVAAKSGDFSFELSDHNPTTIKLHCSSQQDRPAWLSYQHLGSPRASLPVLESYHSLAVPPSRLACSAILQQVVESEESRLLDRLLPSAWWRLLSPGQISPDVKFGSAIPLGWSIIRLSGHMDWNSSTFKDTGTWTVSRTALASLSIAAAFILVTSLWVTLGNSAYAWWIAFSLCIITTVLVPTNLLPLAQFVLLSVCLSAFLRLCAAANSLRSSGYRPRGRSSIISSTKIACIVVSLASCTFGQSPFRFPQQTNEQATFGNSTDSISDLGPMSDSLAVPIDNSEPQIFGVLIPIDESGEVSGAYAYVPTRLLELLEDGSQSQGYSSPPRILSADYTLRVKPSLPGQIEQSAELTAEFRLQFAQADVEIRLPFNSSEVTLSRATVGGQEVFVGGRELYQSTSAIAYRSSAAGVVQLQLQLKPQAIQRNSQSSIQCSIPPIANATLRIVADSSSVFEIKSAGISRKTVSSVSTELIGPVNLLDVAWSPSSARSALGQAPPNVHADTWLQARGDQLAAICQLRIDNARALPRELHLVAEPGWEPVGASWGDGELVAEEVSLLGGRRVYTVRCPDNWAEMPLRTIRVLMVPRASDNASSLALPFFSLREVSQQAMTRTLAWSAENKTNWRPEGLEFWQELSSVPGLEWGELSWKSSKPKLYSVLGTMATSIRRLAAIDQKMIEEDTEVHVNYSEARINFRAQFIAPESGGLTLTIPPGSRVEAVLLDGTPAEHQMAESFTGGPEKTKREPAALIEVFPRNDLDSYQVLEVALAIPLVFNREAKLPRVFVRGFAATRSTYNLFRGVGVACVVYPNSEDNSYPPTTAELQLETARLSTSEMLTKLETQVGRIQLKGSYRQSAALPLTFTVSRLQLPPLIGSVMRIEQRSDQSWKATVTTAWRSGEIPMDFAFFELPVAARDSVQLGTLPMQMIPLGETLTLNLIPPLPVDGVTRVEFSFSVPTATTNQALTIPKVVVLNGAPTTPVLALPASLDGHRVNWTQTGRKLEKLPTELIEEESNFVFFATTTAQSKVSWRMIESETQIAELLLSKVTLLTRNEEVISGYVDYWIKPNGLLHLPLAVPDQCEVLGVKLGTHAALWTIDQQRLEVLLHPNYLPVNIRLLLHWKIEMSQIQEVSSASAAALRIQIPQVELAESSKATLNLADNRLADLRISELSSGERSATRSRRSAYAALWAQVLLDNYSSINNRSAAEFDSWLDYWQPEHVELDGSEALDSEIFQQALQTLGLNNAGAPLESTTRTLARAANASQRGGAAKVGRDITGSGFSNESRRQRKPTRHVPLPANTLIGAAGRFDAGSLAAGGFESCSASHSHFVNGGCLSAVICSGSKNRARPHQLPRGVSMVLLAGTILFGLAAATVGLAKLVTRPDSRLDAVQPSPGIASTQSFVIANIVCNAHVNAVGARCR